MTTNPQTDPVELTISADYGASISWGVSLPAGRSWNQVRSCYVKWDTITILWKDGVEETLHMAHMGEETDTKRPVSFTVLDDDCDPVVEAEGNDWHAEEEAV